jgi:hypothetical protein
MNKLSVIAMLLAAVGCRGLMFESGSWGGAAGSSSYTTDHGTVHRGLSNLTRDGKPYLVLQTAGGEPTDARGGPPGSGTLKAADVREIEWICSTHDGVTGKLVIGGEQFRLENGAVILVDLRGGRMVVEQAFVDMRLFEGGSVEERLKAIAGTNTRVAGFLKASESP